MNLWLFLLLVNLTYIIGQRIPECSDSFIQIIRNIGGLEGRIFIPISFARNNPSLKLTASYSITERQASSNGQLGLLNGKDDAMRQIDSGTRQPLIYQMIFPVEVSRIYFHDILINDQIFCRNPEENIGARFLRTITLTHTLYKITSLNTWEPLPPVLDPGWIPEQTTTRPPRTQSPQGGLDFVLNPSTFWSSPGNNQPPNTRPEVVYEQPRPRPPPFEEDVVTTTPRPPPRPRPRPRPQPTPAPTSPEPVGEINDQNICGALAPRTLVANGEDYSRGDWPWLAAIYSETRTGNNFFCGGSLISPRFVVTAAHCLRHENGTMRRRDQIVVIMGKHLVRSLTERQMQSRNINRYQVHDDFNPINLYADIAMIELSEEVEYTKFVIPLCIWRVTDELSSVVDQVGTVAGWGRDENGLPITDTPKKVTVPIISNEQCRSSHNQFRLFVNDKNFCGGYRNGSSPCTGDSGGGLALKLGDEDRWFLRGIVSYSLNDGSGECNTRQYTVFTDAAKFTAWIIDKIST